MIRLERLWPLILLLSTIAVGVTTFGHVGPPVRPILSLWFLLLCPGMALVRPMRVSGKLMELTLAIALSIVLDTLVGSVLAYGRIWSPDAGVAALMGVCLVGIAMQLGPRISGTAEAGSIP